MLFEYLFASSSITQSRYFIHAFISSRLSNILSLLLLLLVLLLLLLLCSLLLLLVFLLLLLTFVLLLLSLLFAGVSLSTRIFFLNKKHIIYINIVQQHTPNKHLHKQNTHKTNTNNNLRDCHRQQIISQQFQTAIFFTQKQHCLYRFN